MRISSVMKSKILHSVVILLIFCMMLPVISACTVPGLGEGGTEDRTSTLIQDPTEGDADEPPTSPTPTDTPVDGNTEINTETNTDSSTETNTDSSTETNTEVNTDGGTDGDDNTSTPTETVTEEPTDPEPVTDTEAGENVEGIVISKVFGTGGKVDAAMRDSFIELYNPTSKAAKLNNTSIFYGEAGKYRRLDLTGVKISAYGYYLIKCDSVENYNTDYEVLRIDHSNKKWEITIDNKEFSLVYADRMYDPASGFGGADVYDYLVADEIENLDVNYVHNLSKNRMIVRTDMTLEGYHRINLSKAGTSELQKVLPRSSYGANSYVSSKFKEVLFSEEGGVYNRTSLDISLTAPDGWDIYYTLNGDDPRTEGDKYTGDIKISSTNSMEWGETTQYVISIDGSTRPASDTFFGGVVIKAYATNGTESTAVYTQTYFNSSVLKKLNAKIISISVTKEDMFDPANKVYFGFPLFETRNRVRAFFEVFDTDGIKMGGSYAEIAINGKGSSGLPMKSMRLYLKDPLDTNDPALDSIEGDLFDGQATNALGQTITSFDRLLLRNGGNDFGYTMLRDVFTQSMSEGLLVDRLEYEPVIVFMNGEFWGMYNLRERYSPEYFNQHYGVLEDNVVIIENRSPLEFGDDASKPESWDTDYIATTGNELVSHDAYAKEFNDLVAYIKTHDLSIQEHYDYVAARLDIDSFMDYWIVNTYFCNPDWPGNNIKVWRNLDENDPSGMDTKWRFVLLDVDSSVGAQDNSAYSWNKFADISDSTRCGAIMNGLCENAAFCAKFKARAIYVVENIFTYEKCKAELDDMVDGIDNLIEYKYQRFPSHGSYSTWDDQVDKIYDFIKNRKTYYLQHLEERF